MDKRGDLKREFYARVGKGGKKSKRRIRRK